MENVLKTLQKQSEAFEKQSQALNDNTLSKECKSELWKSMRLIEQELTKMKDTIYSNEQGREGLLKQVNDIGKKVDKLLIIMYGGGGILMFMNILPSLKIILGIK